MIQTLGMNENRKIMICVDGYEEGILKGRFYHAAQGMSSFQSLTQFLLKMESLLDELQEPQSYTTRRTFSSVFADGEDPLHGARFYRGVKATFELGVLFRRNSSWQGVLTWKDRKREQNFRSVLELVFLLDSALREQEEIVAS